jgi:4-hydroxy-tetrahydrodipicolinate synthase
MQLGAAGAVNVVGNVLPREVHELVLAAAPGGDSVRAAALVERILPVAQALFLESNPAPLKHALAWLGRCTSELRLPMVPLEPATAGRLEAALADAGLPRKG